MEKILFIVNPRSGVRRTARTEQLVDRYLDRRQFLPKIVYTTHAHHGLALAKEAVADGFDIVVAVGGDGSVNDVANGIYNTRTKMAILPQGSGNGLARSLGIPLNPRKAIALINKKQTVAIDLASANGHIFVSNTGLGFDVTIADQFRRSQRRGLLVYSWLAFKHLWSYRSKRYKIILDNKREIETEAFILSVANAREFGYGFKIAPPARLSDGLLDLTILRPFPKYMALAIVYRAFAGSLLQSRYVIHDTAKTVSIAQKDTSYMQSDGDYFACITPLQISIIPQALHVIAPTRQDNALIP